MAIFDLFSKRQRRQRGEVPDVYQYDNVPEALRVQLAHVFRDALGDLNASYSKGRIYLTQIHDALCREYGVFYLVEDARIRGTKPEEDLYRFFLVERDTDKVIDVVELFVTVINGACRGEGFIQYSQPKISPDSAIDEINERFREHGVGFQIESGEMIRVDSQVIHQSVVRPALELLRDADYHGANEEFLRAHEHYRHGRNPESLNDSLKAFESTLKVICGKRQWSFKPTDTAKALLDVVFQNDLVPTYLQSHYSSLRSNLESGVPTVRNKLGGHGQGTQQVVIPQHFVAYQLHMTASAIVFLVESEKAMP